MAKGDKTDTPPVDDVDASRAGEDVNEVLDISEEEWSSPWMLPFLRAAGNTPSVTDAARAAGVTRQAVHQAAKRHPRFRIAWQQAKQETVDHWEQFATAMGTTGLEQTETTTVTRTDVEGRTSVTVTEKKTRFISPQVLMFMLSAHRPDVYRRPTRLEHTGADGGPIESVTKEQTDAAVGGLAARLDELAGRRRARDDAGGSGERERADTG